MTELHYPSNPSSHPGEKALLNRVYCASSGAGRVHTGSLWFGRWQGCEFVTSSRELVLLAVPVFVSLVKRGEVVRVLRGLNQYTSTDSQLAT